MEKTSELVTIMFVDLVGYTKRTSRLSRDKLDQLHDTFDTLAIPIFQKNCGKVIKKIGDAFLVIFRSATNAVLCGVELQKNFIEYNKDHISKKDPLRIRVALHTGEVLFRNGDIYGEAVNIAARIEGVAEEGQIVLSDSVFTTMNKNEIPCVYIGARKLKGIKYPVRLFKVKSKYDKILQRPKLKRKEARRRRQGIRNFFINIGLMVIIFAVLAMAYVFLKQVYGL